MEIFRYTYKPKALHTVLAGAFFAVCGFSIIQQARTNQQGLIIDGFIRLDPHDATLFYWGLGGCSIVLVCLSLLGLYRAMTSRHELTLDETHLHMPKSGLGTTIKSVAYRDIIAMSLMKVRSQRFLTIQYPGGKVNISSSLLPDRVAFETVCNVIADRVKAARAQP